MRDDVELLQKLVPLVGDVTQPGREEDRVAVEVSISQIRNVMHLGSPTGSDLERGMRENCPGMPRAAGFAQPRRRCSVFPMSVMRRSFKGSCFSCNGPLLLAFMAITTNTVRYGMNFATRCRMDPMNGLTARGKQRSIRSSKLSSMPSPATRQCC